MKLKTAYIVDLDQLSEETQQLLYEYFRGNKNGSYLDLHVGDGHYDDGLWRSGYDFSGDCTDADFKPTEFHKDFYHTKMIRAVLKDIGWHTQEDINKALKVKKQWDKDLLVYYWW